jgi:circadian clock protein KaiB
MSAAGKPPTLERFKRTLADLEARRYSLTLFVSGASDSSTQAVGNIRQICDMHLGGRYKLSIIDLNQEPQLAVQQHVLATPTLVKDGPLPFRMLVGDMSNHLKVLSALDVNTAVVGEPPPSP